MWCLTGHVLTGRAVLGYALLKALCLTPGAPCQIKTIWFKLVGTNLDKKYGLLPLNLIP